MGRLESIGRNNAVDAAPTVPSDTSPRNAMQRLSDLYIHSESAATPIRVGLLVDNDVLLRSFAEIVRDMRRSNFVSIELVVMHQQATPPTAPPAHRSMVARIWATMRRPNFFRDLGWDLYSRMDARFGTVENDPVAPEPCADLLAGIDTLHVVPITKGFVHRFPDDAMEAIRARNLDVIIRFGFNILRGEILDAARFGVWSFHHGDNDQYRGGPAHFWEMVEGNPLSGVILQVLTDELDAGRVLAKGHFATAAGLSLKRNRVQPYWGSMHMVLQKLWELHTYGWKHLQDGQIPPAPYTGKRKIYRRPTTIEMVRWVVPTVAAKAMRKLQRAFTGADLTDHWRMAIRPTAAAPFRIPVDMARFTWIESPHGHFYADPFLFEDGNTTHLFFEDYAYAQGRAVIAHAELDDRGNMGAVRTVLDTGTHASYPCVFADDESIYMLPETIQAGGVRLYKAQPFPHTWTNVADILHGPVVDSTIFREAGRWWLFATVRDPRGRGLALCLFWADTPSGPWLYHPKNPISLDIRRARGAGHVLRDDLGLIRPSQDCSARYGSSFEFNRIVRLSTDDYGEELVQRIEPTWAQGLVTTHTFNRVTRFEVTDGQVSRPTRTVR